MFENETRHFTDAEIKKAENMLLILASESARFWTNAIMSGSFLYQGETYYHNSDFYKSSQWVDRPNEKHEPITAEQILKFMEVYLDEAKETINRWLEDDKQVALILGLKSRVPEEQYWAFPGEFSFGGWDNDPCGAVAVAKKEAGLVGTMSVNSPYRKTMIMLCKGKIYRWRCGSKEILMTVDIQQ